MNDLPEGHVISSNDITYKRRGTGISPLHWDEVLGMKVSKELKEDHVLQWKDLE